MFVIGEHHDIIAYYSCDSESEEQLKPAFMALRARLERLGKLHYLQFWVTDRCCEGGNPLEHWITKIFPGITRAPLKDRFHLVKAVLQTLNEGFPQLKSDIGQELIAALIEFPEAEMAPVVRHLRSKGKARSDTQARSIAKKTHRKNLRFKAHPALLQHQRWKACRLRWTAHAEEKWNAKERCVIRKQSDYTTGTLEAMEDAEVHLLKGCAQQPFVDDYKLNFLHIKVRPCYHGQRALRHTMATVVCVQTEPKTGLDVFKIIDHSVKNESAHRDVNRLVEGVARVEKDLSKVVLGFKVHSINTRVDHERGLVDGHSLCFFPSADRVFNEQADELLTGGPLFPIAATSHRSTLEPIGPDHPHREHFGFDYYDWMQSQKAASSAAAAAAATTTASTTAAPSAAGLGRPDACGSLSGDEASDSDSDCSIASFASDGARSDANSLASDASQSEKPSSRKRRKRQAPGDQKGTKGTARKPVGGPKKTRAMKSSAPTFFHVEVVKPTTVSEVSIAVRALEAARGERCRVTPNTYKTAASTYNSTVFNLFTQGDEVAAHSVRYAPTNGTLLQQLFTEQSAAANRLRQEARATSATSTGDSAQLSTCIGDSAALSRLHQQMAAIAAASQAGDTAAETLASITSIPPSTKKSRPCGSGVGKEPKTPSRYRKYDDSLRHAPVEVKLSDVRHPIVTPMSVRLLKRLAKSFGVSSNSRKCTELLVKEVAEAWRKQRPTETVIKLDALPQPQPEAGDSVLRAEASTTVAPNPASVGLVA